MSKPPLASYYGARVALDRGDEVPPGDTFVYCTPNLDAAIWAAELAEGDEAPRVSRVAVTGSTEKR